MAGKSPNRVELSQGERKALQAMANKYSSPYREVIRAKIILYAERGLTNPDFRGF